VNLVVAKNQVYQPDASVYLTVTEEHIINFYHEDIAKDLNKFYIGSLLFSNHSVAFSAVQAHGLITGSAFLLGTKVNLYCPLDIWPGVPFDIGNETTKCFSCKVFISPYSKKIQNSERNISANYSGNVNKLDGLTPIDTSPEPYENSNQVSRLRKQKRSSKSHQIPKTCSLYLESDPLFYKFVGNRDFRYTINKMLNLINSLDSIFRSTDFDGDGWADNVGFIVKKVGIKTDSDRHLTTKADMVATEYLREFGSHNYSEYCLAIAFTFKDFSGTAGSAYTAFSDGSQAGGICQKQVGVDSSNYTSFNTVLLTYLLNGRRRTEIGTLLTLAHEVGHSFGAHHDEEPECTGTEEHGNFIMNPMTNSGYKVNNFKFSNCSLRNMLPVIALRDQCLTHGNFTPQCGNGLPEEGEECDCGWSQHCDMVDHCCTPADQTEGPDRPCTLRRSQGKFCSPSVSPCCTDTCTFIPKAMNTTCNRLSYCSYPSSCNGLSSHCPHSYLPEGTACNGGLQVCSQGRCLLGACQYHNLSVCFCHGANQCETCCQQNNSCAPLSYFISLNNSPLLQDDALCSERLRYPTDSLSISWLSEILVLTAHLRQYWIYYVFFGAIIVFINAVLTFSCSAEETDNSKSLRYGKMLVVEALEQHMSEVYDDILKEIDTYYKEAVTRSKAQKMPMGYLKALSRLKALFPAASVEYLSKIVKISATEEVAVKLLIIQGFKMK
ncbi:hypothetical protein EGW08_012867, partial [Elysia chlorotica]